MAKIDDIYSALQVAFDAAEELDKVEELGKILISLSKERKKVGRVIFRELFNQKLAIHSPPKIAGNLGFFRNIVPENHDQYYYWIAPGDQVSICKYEVEETLDTLEVAMEKMINELEADGHFVILQGTKLNYFIYYSISRTLFFTALYLSRKYFVDTDWPESWPEENVNNNLVFILAGLPLVGDAVIFGFLFYFILYILFALYTKYHNLKIIRNRKNF